MLDVKIPSETVYSQGTDKDRKLQHKYILGVLPYKENK